MVRAVVFKQKTYNKFKKKFFIKYLEVLPIFKHRLKISK